MADGSRIEWCDATWNPTVGCSVLSPGCKHCYAMKLAGRLDLMGLPMYQGYTIKMPAGFVWNGRVSLSTEQQLIKPLLWRRPRRIFVNSMSDLMHEALPDATVDLVMGIIARFGCDWHKALVLTKRDERMLRYMSDPETPRRIWTLIADDQVPDAPECPLAPQLPEHREAFIEAGIRFGWPLPGLWLGVSVEDRERLARIDRLRRAPAAVRFLSIEPLLEDLGELDLSGIDWVIVGGETGPRARDMDPAWARSIRAQCRAAGVAFFMKQMAKQRPIPEDLFVREFPLADAA